ncbi:MAG: hypothetical protein RML72_09360, partial [Bacteroidia bacterium]|nr:hypothetical protein [Bacteroidia bacterium]MDW8159065.1 hypothetical protein [Bacteroidia bacterium]
MFFRYLIVSLLSIVFTYYSFCQSQQVLNAPLLSFDNARTDTTISLEAGEVSRYLTSSCITDNFAKQAKWFRLVIEKPGDVFIGVTGTSATLTLYKELPTPIAPIWGCTTLLPVPRQQSTMWKRYAWQQTEMIPGQIYFLQVVERDSLVQSSTLQIKYVPDNFTRRRSKFSSLIQPLSGPNHTCDKAICIVRGIGYTNRDRPYCYPCTGIWAPPEVTCSGASSWGLMDNPVFFKFEVLPTTPQPVTVSLFVDFCQGGSSTLQMGIWSAERCPGGG